MAKTTHRRDFYARTGIDREKFGIENDIPYYALNRLPARFQDALRTLLQQESYGYEKHEYGPHWNVKLHMDPDKESFIQAYRDAAHLSDGAVLPLPEAAFDAWKNHESDIDPRGSEFNWTLENMRRGFTEDDTYKTASPTVLKRWGLDPDTTWVPEFAFVGRSGGYLALLNMGGGQLPTPNRHDRTQSAYDIIAEILLEAYNPRSAWQYSRHTHPLWDWDNLDSYELIEAAALCDELDQSLTQENLAAAYGHALGDTLGRLDWTDYLSSRDMLHAA